MRRLSALLLTVSLMFCSVIIYSCKADSDTQAVQYPDPAVCYSYSVLDENMRILYRDLCSVLTNPQVGIEYKLTYMCSYEEFDYIKKLAGTDFPMFKTVIDSAKLLMNRSEFMFVSDSADVRSEISAVGEKYAAAVSAAEKAEKDMGELSGDFEKALGIADRLTDSSASYRGDSVADSTGAETAECEDGNSYEILAGKDSLAGGIVNAYDFLCRRAGLKTVIAHREENGEASADDSGDYRFTVNMVCIDGDWYFADLNNYILSGKSGDLFVPAAVLEKSFGSAAYIKDPQTGAELIPEADSWKYCDNVIQGSYDEVLDMLKSESLEGSDEPYESFDIYFTDSDSALKFKSKKTVVFRNEADSSERIIALSQKYSDCYFNVRIMEIGKEIDNGYISAFCVFNETVNTDYSVYSDDDIKISFTVPAYFYDADCSYSSAIYSSLCDGTGALELSCCMHIPSETVFDEGIYKVADKASAVDYTVYTAECGSTDKGCEYVMYYIESSGISDAEVFVRIKEDTAVHIKGVGQEKSVIDRIVNSIALN